MPFPRIDLKLTDEQIAALKPFAEEIARDNQQNIVAEMFVIDHDRRFREVRVRLLDAIAARSIRDVNRAAQEDYDARQGKARRLGMLRDALAAQSIVATVSDDVVVVHHNKHRYELREVDSPTT